MVRSMAKKEKGERISKVSHFVTDDIGKTFHKLQLFAYQAYPKAHKKWQ